MAAAAEHLARVDPRWRRVIERHGPFRVAHPRRSDFEAIARMIVFQQLSGRAASSIHDRLVGAFGGTLDPAAVARARVRKLRAAGLSAAKATAIRSLARVVASEGLDFRALRRRSDDEIERTLSALPGIGPWTAHMYLLFHLRRPDVWPTGDYGVRKGFQMVLGLGALPSARELAAHGEPYRPHRSAVAWYCWRALDVRVPGG